MNLRLLFIVSSALVAPIASAGGQIIYGGAAVITGPGVSYGPRIGYPPYSSAEESALYLDSAEACLRLGRCSALDVYRFQGRPNRLQRLAPLAPQDAARISGGPIGSGEATPREHIVPAYRDASQLRPEYSEAGKLRAAPAEAPSARP